MPVVHFNFVLIIFLPFYTNGFSTSICKNWFRSASAHTEQCICFSLPRLNDISGEVQKVMVNLVIGYLYQFLKFLKQTGWRVFKPLFWLDKDNKEALFNCVQCFMFKHTTFTL